MPLYEYECEACGQRFEVIRKFSDPPLDVCRQCGQGPIRRMPSSPAIQFKGSGFYITDYPKTGAAAGRGDKRSSEEKQDAKSDAAASDKGSTASEKSDSTKSDSAGSSGTAAKPDAPPKSAPTAKPSTSPAPANKSKKD
ncbi:MAG: zinc ribbon domain-containing protein [Acidobacteria bacterium]|nr:zinc ribbon domain-containing protein [Acidobacteriota bacterium]